MEEIWREVPDYPRYEFSSYGRVRSKGVVSNHWRGGKRTYKGILLITKCKQRLEDK
jgi:hypothetical protein